MLKDLINPEATNTTDIFRIDEKRLSEIQNELFAIQDIIAENYKDYTLARNETEGELLIGKIIEKMLPVAKNTNEEYFICYCITIFLDNIRHAIQTRVSGEAMLKKIFPNAKIFGS